MNSDIKTFPANMDTISQIMDFIADLCEDMPEQSAFDIALASEEILVNIASYAYPEGEGELAVRWVDETEKRTLTIAFEDSGVQFNPLKKEAPDLNVPFLERKIGGLGIMMVRQRMDSVTYEYSGGKNILTITKGY